MFALFGRREEQDQINLKCDPAQAFILRDIFDAVIPGYHMNKRHWNAVILNGSIPNGEIEDFDPGEEGSDANAWQGTLA